MTTDVVNRPSRRCRARWRRNSQRETSRPARPKGSAIARPAGELDAQEQRDDGDEAEQAERGREDAPVLLGAAAEHSRRSRAEDGQEREPRSGEQDRHHRVVDGRDGREVGCAEPHHLRADDGGDHHHGVGQSHAVDQTAFPLTARRHPAGATNSPGGRRILARCVTERHTFRGVGCRHARTFRAENGHGRFIDPTRQSVTLLPVRRTCTVEHSGRAHIVGSHEKQPIERRDRPIQFFRPLTKKTILDATSTI